jgi:predicted O-methyltransferase YrrM
MTMLRSRIKKLVKSYIHRTGFDLVKFETFQKLTDDLTELKALHFVPPGHFYSPLVDRDDLKKREKILFDSIPRTIPGVSLREDDQLALLKIFAEYYKDLPFSPEQKDGLRYYYENPNFSYSDGIFLCSMIRHFKPQRIIEVGSGFSSAMILDTNELYFNNSIDLTFVEPYPKLLYSVMKESDRERVKVVPAVTQDVSLDLFQSLNANDILFIDSTHVSKTGSDVNRIFFEILPALKSGVLVHFHDIFYPLEYPKEWVFEGRAWTEAYLLKAFLQYNSQFEILICNTFLQHFHVSFFRQHMPLCLNRRGGNIWIRKI